jgi:hypothetical protein
LLDGEPSGNRRYRLLVCSITRLAAAASAVFAVDALSGLR